MLPRRRFTRARPLAQFPPPPPIRTFQSDRLLRIPRRRIRRIRLHHRGLRLGLPDRRPAPLDHLARHPQNPERPAFAGGRGICWNLCLRFYHLPESKRRCLRFRSAGMSSRRWRMSLHPRNFRPARRLQPDCPSENRTPPPFTVPLIGGLNRRIHILSPHGSLHLGSQGRGVLRLTAPLGGGRLRRRRLPIPAY